MVVCFLSPLIIWFLLATNFAVNKSFELHFNANIYIVKSVIILNHSNQCILTNDYTLIEMVCQEFILNKTHQLLLI